MRGGTLSVHLHPWGRLAGAHAEVSAATRWRQGPHPLRRSRTAERTAAEMHASPRGFPDFPLILKK